ncbi:MAG: hypothetical protein V4773_06850 [Verrucomicrobiota bacterium]
MKTFVLLFAALVVPALATCEQTSSPSKARTVAALDANKAPTKQPAPAPTPSPSPQKPTPRPAPPAHLFM